MSDGEAEKPTNVIKKFRLIENFKDKLSFYAVGHD